MEKSERSAVNVDASIAFPEGPDGGAGRPFTHRSPKPWSVVVLSALLSAAAVAAVGCLCALAYPIIKELRAERVRGENGAEEKMLGFWSITVLSMFVGCTGFIFSWTLTYFDSYQPGMMFPTPLAHFRDVSGEGLHMGYGVAVLNGIMAMLTVIWSLN